MRLLTAGESHNKGLMAILEGLPAGLTIDEEKINNELKLRQGGYGRGKRMQIESDKVNILSGVRQGATIGSPISLLIDNKDWQNYQDIYHNQGLEYTTPRPGHADLPGMLKYNFQDCRNVLERASARNTAILVAVGSICQQFLWQFNIVIHSYVKSIHNIVAKNSYEYNSIYDSPVYCMDSEATTEMIKLIENTKTHGDSIGGTVETVVLGLPPGLGDYSLGEFRLDGILGGAVLSIPSVKGVEIGVGFDGTRLLGSEYHDEIYYDNGVIRKTNRAGGIEGGMTNGETLVLRAAIKPIPTVIKGISTIDVSTTKETTTDYQRSDTTVIPAASVIIKNVVALEITKQFLKKFGGDHMDDTIKAYNNYLKRIEVFYNGNKGN